MYNFGKNPRILRRNLPVCNIDFALEVLPAMSATIWEVCSKTLKLASLFSKRVFLSFVMYISGLIFLDMNQTAKGIAEALGFVSHDALNRLLTKFQWSCTAIMITLLNLAKSLGINGYLIIDDVIVPKRRSKRIFGVYWDYDHNEKKSILCQRFVVIIWTNSKIKIPVAFALWHKRGYVKKYRTKNQLARILLHSVMRRGLRVRYVTFDNWYASKKNLRFAKKYGLHYVTRLKRNSLIKSNGEKIPCKKLSSKFSKSRFRYYRGIDAYAKTFVVYYGSIGPLKLVIVKNDSHEEKGATKYIITDVLEAYTQDVVNLYRSRWAIEVFFRDLKQHLGLSGCQTRSREAIMRHVTLTFVAHTCLELLKDSKEQTIGDVKKTLQRLVIVRILGQYVTLIKFSNVKEPKILFLLQRLVRTRLSEVSNLKLPDSPYVRESA